MDVLLQTLGPEGKGVGSLPAPAVEVRNILAPVDFSPTSRRGPALAGDVAACFRSLLSVLYVLQPPAVPTWDYVHPGGKETELRRKAEEQLTHFVLECGIDPRLVCSTSIRLGDADFEICKAAVEKGADLIVNREPSARIEASFQQQHCRNRDAPRSLSGADCSRRCAGDRQAR